MINKDKKKCSTTVWSRITGYFQPVQQWNPGKFEEFKNRKTFEKVLDPERPATFDKTEEYPPIEKEGWK